MTDVLPLNKKNLEDHLIQIDPHFSILDPIIRKFGLNDGRIKIALAEKHAPKPAPLKNNKGLFAMRRHKGRDYNIFETVDGKFVGITFDINRRPFYQTVPAETPDRAIDYSRQMLDILVKGQFTGLGIKLDEGKAIREKEQGLQKEAAKERRK